MMLTRLLGFADLLAAIAILLAGGMPHSISMTLAIYLIAKGGIFSLLGDRVSLVDVLCGFCLLAAANGLSFTIVSVAAAAFLVQKAVFSLV